MEFRVLGPLEVTADGQPLSLTGARTRAVLAMLLVHANQVVSSDRLIEELWPGQPRAADSLQVRLSELRKALRSAGRPTAWPPGRPVTCCGWRPGNWTRCDSSSSPPRETRRWRPATPPPRRGGSMRPCGCGAAQRWPTWTPRHSPGQRRAARGGAAGRAGVAGRSAAGLRQAPGPHRRARDAHRGPSAPRTVLAAPDARPVPGGPPSRRVARLPRPARDPDRRPSHRARI